MSQSTPTAEQGARQGRGHKRGPLRAEGPGCCRPCTLLTPYRMSWNLCAQEGQGMARATVVHSLGRWQPTGQQETATLGVPGAAPKLQN